jgi:hypothetical protein
MYCDVRTLFKVIKNFNYAGVRSNIYSKKTPEVYVGNVTGGGAFADVIDHNRCFCYLFRQNRN